MPDVVLHEGLETAPSLRHWRLFVRDTIYAASPAVGAVAAVVFELLAHQQRRWAAYACGCVGARYRAVHAAADSVAAGKARHRYQWPRQSACCLTQRWIGQRSEERGVGKEGG